MRLNLILQIWSNKIVNYNFQNIKWKSRLRPGVRHPINLPKLRLQHVHNVCHRCHMWSEIQTRYCLKTLCQLNLINTNEIEQILVWSTVSLICVRSIWANISLDGIDRCKLIWIITWPKFDAFSLILLKQLVFNIKKKN